jgi:hypothetical protein
MLHNRDDDVRGSSRVGRELCCLNFCLNRQSVSVRGLYKCELKLILESSTTSHRPHEVSNFNDYMIRPGHSESYK